MQRSSNGYCIKIALFPVLNRICSQYPIKIDWRKLLQLPLDDIQKMQLTHYKLAWIQAILESNIPSFTSIDWHNHDLLIRVNKIQIFFRGALETSIQEYLETENAQKEKLWNKIGIIGNDDNQSFKSNIYPEYLVSRSVAIQLIRIAPLTSLGDETLNKLVKKYKQNENERRHPILAQVGLVSEVMLNVKNYCTEGPVQLDVTKLPSRMWLKYLAGYLALPSTQASLYSDIVYNDSFLNHASRIHIDLRKALNKKFDITIDLFSEMLVDQLKIAEDSGVIDVALVAVNKSGSSFDNLSCEITRELAIELLRSLPEFHNLLESNTLEVGKLKLTVQSVPSMSDAEKIDKVIEKRLSKTLKQNIKDTNPRYEGAIWDKTSVPHTLILKTMCIMIELNYPRITWSTIKDFIEEHILPNYEMSILGHLKHIDDYTLEAGGFILEKKSCQDRVSEYKRTVFNIK